MKKKQKLKKRLLLLFLTLLLASGTSVFANDSEKALVIEEQTAVLDRIDNKTPQLDLIADSNSLLAKKVYGAETISSSQPMFTDVKPDNWAYQALEEISKKYGVLKGMPDGTFQGDKETTRYELAQALVNTIQKLEEDHVKVSAIEQAALKSLKDEFDKEIVALAARIEHNETRINKLATQYETDVDYLSNEVKMLNKKHHFVPEFRFQYGFGDNQPANGNLATGRLRLNSKSKIYDNTVGIIRLEALSTNFINSSERNGDVVDTDLTLGYVITGDLTKWIPDKLGKLNLAGGILPPNWFFYTGHYSVTVDQRPFVEANSTLSPFNTTLLAYGREGPNGRRMSIGGEYIKKFSKYNGLIKAMGFRATGGSLNLPGADIAGSGDESTFYAVSGQIDLPFKQPVELKVTHTYSFGDAATNKKTYSIGGRLATKFEGVGVFKAAFIGHGGSRAPRLLGGLRGHGFSYQFSYNPTIKAFGNLFGDPDRITYNLPKAKPVAGKTEIGLAIAHLFNEVPDQSLIAFDIYASRFFTDNIFGRVLFTHANPRVTGFASRTSVLLETVFKL